MDLAAGDMMNAAPEVAALSVEIRRKYDQVAPRYDLLEALPELLAVRRLRQRLLQRASRKVLEVAVGTGKNLPHYPAGCQITAVDLSQGMLALARKRSARLGLDVGFLQMDAGALTFPDQTFDTVVSTLSVCTFPDPMAALREMGRVCRPDGRILLLEHGRGDRPWLARWQDRTAHRHAQALGCHWNREPLDLVRQAGLRITVARRTFLGIWHEIETMPPVET